MTQGSGAEREYEFIPGVRELLLDTVRRSEAIKVSELVSAELDRTYGTAGHGYTAFVGAGTREGEAPGNAVRAYSAVGAHVLRRIGGRYAEAAMATAAETTAPARTHNDGLADRKAALLVATADRSRRPYLDELNSLAAMLRDPDVAGFAETQILADIPAGRLDERIHSFLVEHGEANLIMVYLVGRAVIGADNRLWLTNEDDVPREPTSRYADLTRMTNLLGESRARRKLVVLDGDYHHSAFEMIAGGDIDVLTVPFPEDALVGSPVRSAGLTLCRAITQALTGELPGLPTGGIITLDQICQYAYNHSISVGDSVSVQWYRSGTGTDMPFARVRRAAPTAVPAARTQGAVGTVPLARTQSAAATEESSYARTLAITKPELGSLSFLGEGGFGKIFRLDSYRLPQDNMPLAYKEFIRGIDVQVHSATLAVSFREQLSADEREVLDSFSAWPRAVVSDIDGRTCGCLLPLLSRDYYAEQADVVTSERTNVLLEMQWLIASERQMAHLAVDIPAVSQQDRLRLLARLAHAIAWLHHRSWVYGGISFKNIAFSADCAHIMLLDCDSAAAVADPQRQQPLTPFWVPPELEGAPVVRLQDPESEVYQLGLAILRCLTPGAGAAAAKDPGRLASVLDATGIVLVTRALSADRSARPTASELARYLDDLAAAGADVEGSQGHRTADSGQVVMPFYVVLDVSYSMIGAISDLNDAIQEMWRGILRNPLVDDIVQICLISFSDVARVITPMCPASQSRPPVITVEGGTNYGNAFRLLAQTIARDVADLKQAGYRVFRPCAFFLTDGEPLDYDYLEVFTRELTYDPRSGRGMRDHPNFVPFGFGDVPEDVIGRLAYPAGRSRWFHSRSTDLAEGLREVLSVIMNSVVASGASASAGRPFHAIQC